MWHYIIFLNKRCKTYGMQTTQILKSPILHIVLRLIFLTESWLRYILRNRLRCAVKYT